MKKIRMLKIKLDEGPEICHFPAGPSGPTVVHTNPNYGGLPQDNPDNSGIERDFANEVEIYSKVETTLLRTIRKLRDRRLKRILDENKNELKAMEIELLHDCQRKFIEIVTQNTDLLMVLRKEAAKDLQHFSELNLQLNERIARASQTLKIIREKAVVEIDEQLEVDLAFLSSVRREDRRSMFFELARYWILLRQLKPPLCTPPPVCALPAPPPSVPVADCALPALTSKIDDISEGSQEMHLDEGQRSSRESPIPAETGSVEDNPLEYLMAQLLPDESSAEI
ncbi:uncharacterized protein [Oscarella lobularis]|uniref:uncharacterized protein isoform X2 n=1 Tax=Oscarella lobularis TaxID=121494 RepID=UPI0033131104